MPVARISTPQTEIESINPDILDRRFFPILLIVAIHVQAKDAQGPGLVRPGPSAPCVTKVQVTTPRRFVAVLTPFVVLLETVRERPPNAAEPATFTVTRRVVALT